MGPEVILLVKLLTDVGMTLFETINKVSTMKEEEVNANIEMAEALSKVLRERRKGH